MMNDESNVSKLMYLTYETIKFCLRQNKLEEFSTRILTNYADYTNYFFNNLFNLINSSKFVFKNFTNCSQLSADFKNIGKSLLRSRRTPWEKDLGRSLFFLFLFLKNPIYAQSSAVNQAVGDFHFLYMSIRDGEINEQLAQDSTRSLLSRIKEHYIENGGQPDSTSHWIFPVESYGMNMIGGKKGSDYIPGNYNFYNTARVHVHPAHDIFVADNNQDKLDDRTQLPVNILSFTSGIVVSVEYFWDVSSTKRGGNFIYIYEPFSKKMYYYAHNELVLVQLGDIVKAGQNIATMGRSGFNAYKERSPTHLHFSMLQFDEQGNARPVKPYSFLLKAHPKSSGQ